MITKNQSWEEKMKKEAKKLPKNTAKDNQAIDDFFNKAFQKMNIKQAF